MDLITFKLADKEYAVDINQVHEVLRVREAVPVPDAADFVEGVINLRGKVVPLVSLRKKLGFKESELKRASRIIIAQSDSHFIGVIVDRVSDVISLDPADITPPDEVLKKATYLTGVGRIGERLILIVDIKTLLSDREKIDIEEMHGRVEIRKRG
ncbi:MAG: chemotaxis protein CheW [Candidatus Makaraimicrobium thalassicum]|nr:MAG: chemotaxis protein CheW [Candidatus Omnitrophota bacterium]